MRVPSDLGTPRPPRRRGRARWWLIGGVVVILIVLASLRSLASIYTDGLWFSSVHYHDVFSTLLVIKLGLFGVFGAIFFVVLWVNLVVCDRLASSGVGGVGGEDELVRRYQQVVRPHAGRIYVALAFVLALIAASGTIGEWQNWILFRHGGNFGAKDPQFGKDVGFYVFKLPFMSFVVDWTLAILIVTLIVTTIFHYFNGGIVPQRGLPRVRPPVKAHLSVLLALIALTKAVGYVLQRWSMVNAQDGYVNGAGYTDVHARLPAQELLIVISIFAAGILLYNIRQQGWTLPVLAVGVWAFVALVVGVIYPALLQALKVNPAQSSLEAPYIQRNIEATRAAYGVQNVKVHNFNASNSATPSEEAQSTATLANIRLWDPDSSISLQSFTRLQAIRTYYDFPSVSVDRYTINDQMTPVIVGVREISSSNIPAASWVNTHLQFTHGNGAVVALANQESSSNPVFGISGVPPSSSDGLPKIKQPNVYFGLGETGYTVVNTKQAEVDYQRGNSNVESHYSGKTATGGVQLSSFFTRAAFALRLGDFNLLISDQITSKSRIMFVRDPLQMAEKAAPFLSFDHDPYAVVTNDGQIDWIVDGYTTTNQYPYSENADTQQIPLGSGLPGSYNYVRNSVKVIINAYSGQMTFYDVDSSDPILKAYEAAFPHMFTPLSKMPSDLQAHLRYPEDIFAIQSAIYGRYHLTSSSAFYAASDSWQLSPTAGAGPGSQALTAVNTYNAQGQLVSTNPARMAPLYQVMALPGSSTQAFTITEAFVPAAQSGSNSSNQNLNLSAFMIGNSDPSRYGQLSVYQTPAGTTGPANADAEIDSNQAVSKDISLLDTGGSKVLLGNTLMVPAGQTMIYLRPLYVASSSNPQPTLQYVIGVVGHNVYVESSLANTLSDIFKVPVTVTPSGSTTPVSSSTGTATGTTVPAAVQSDLSLAQTDYQNAQTALQNGQLGNYQSDIAAMDSEISAAQKATAAAAGTGTATTTSTTAPKSKAKTTTTTSKSKQSTKATDSASTEPKESTTTTTLASAAAGS
ncbi:MAG TPA: UPF0182 family protein [Acidimicrobiales bacterium]